jgi:hypothetical protein
MKHSVYELEGALLDDAVALALGVSLDLRGLYSRDWAQGGPIIERERIEICGKADGVGWYAGAGDAPFTEEREFEALGPTPLIAAMRAYVASKLGDEVDL